jgi:hypothetical protein
MAAAPSDPIWAVVFVHGVGDTGPGKTLDAVLPTLRQINRGGLTEIAQPETRLLPEPPPGLPPPTPVPPPTPQDTSKVEMTSRFPAHVRRFSVNRPRAGDPAQAAFAEVYWADLSTAGEGALRLLLRLFTAIFDLRFIPYVASACDFFTARTLRLVLYLISWLLCGPIAGSTAFIAYLLAAHYAVPRVPVVGLALIGAVFGGLLVLLHRWLKLRGQWLFVIGWIIVAAVSDVVYSLMTMHAFPKNLEAMLLVLGTLFLAVGALTIISFVTWCGARVEAVLKQLGRAGPALNAALAATLLQVGLWVMVVPAIGIAMLKEWSPDAVSGKDPVFANTFLAFTQDMALTLVVAACAVLVWLARARSVRREPRPYTAETTRRIPRLLVNDIIVAAIVAVSLAGAVATIYAALSGQPRFGGLLSEYRRLTVGGTLILVVVISAVFQKGLGNALHILMDIVSHFSREHLPVPSLSKTEKPDLNDFTVQQKLEARFRSVLDEVLQMGNVTHLTIVAHSQGTMIAIDVLWFTWAANRLHGIEVDLVTMGSPFTHLYQYYFPNRYPPLFIDGGLNDQWGSHLTTTVKSWLNIYRVDDFVGTHIDGNGTFPTNVCIAAGGHTGYWHQREALEAMRECLPGR